MKKAIIAIIVMFALSACQPVMDPAKWDPTMYCQTTQSCDTD